MHNSVREVYLIQSYINIGEFTTAEEWGKKCLELSEENKILLTNCQANIHMGVLSLEKKDSANAFKYLLKAKKLIEENNFLKDYIVLLHGIFKNESKIPETDKLKAKKRMFDFQIRYKEGKIKLP